MTADIFALLALWSTCEVGGQILFKRGVDLIDAGEDHFGFASFRQALLSPKIWIGSLVHIIEFALWIEILGRLPLSIAFPLESASYVLLLLATRVFLREVIPIRRWIGLAMICAGIAVLGIT